MKFEDLLPRPIEELTDSEISDIIEKLSADELAKFEKKLSKRKTKRKPTKAQKQRDDEFERAFLGGL